MGGRDTCHLEPYHLWRGHSHLGEAPNHPEETFCSGGAKTLARGRAELLGAGSSGVGGDTSFILVAELLREHPGHWKMSEASGGDQPISNQLANLVPTFDPAKDDVTIYQQKVELVLAAWPRTKITELTTRLILNCTGTAFQKLQLHQSELLAENDPKAVQQLIKLLGGQWGRVSLEKQYQEAENALFGTTQRADESNDSYLARADVQWMKLIAQKLKVEDLQAYVVLRGSQLSPEDKKKVILESDSSLEGRLTMSRVNEAVRLLGATFFQDMTGGKRLCRTKVYEQSALQAESYDDDGPNETLAMGHDENEDDFIDGLAHDGDEDATLVADFELAASETLQDDPSLAEAFNAYQEARRRLSEKFRNRGFWPTSKGSYSSSKGKGGKFTKGKGGKGGFDNRPRRSLQDRILNSNCRICGRKGHWRAECPYKGSSQGSTTGSTTSGAVPTTTVITESTIEEPDVLPMEFMNLPEHRTLDEDCGTKAHPCRVSEMSVFHVLGQYGNYQKGIQIESWGNRSHIEGVGHNRLKARFTRNRPGTLQTEPSRKSESARARLKQQISVLNARRVQPEPTSLPAASNPVHRSCHKDPPESPKPNAIQEENQICFATYGSMGVLDLGASKTVIGSDHVAEMLDGLSPQVRDKVTRCACQVTFRFGNQGTLQSKHAIIVPIGPLLLKVAIVPGGTPFLLSNSLMRALSAQIDCQSKTLHSPLLEKPIKLSLTNKGLFLINLDELATNASTMIAAKPTSPMTETFVSEDAEQRMPADAEPVEPCHQPIEAKCNLPKVPKVDQSNQLSCTPCDEQLNINSSVKFNVPATNSHHVHESAITVSTHMSPGTQLLADRMKAVLPESESIPKVTSDQINHVASAAFTSHADERDGADQRSGPHEPRATSPGGHRLRGQTQGQNLPRCVGGRPRMGDVHGEPLSRKHETQPQEVPSLRGSSVIGARETPAPGPRDEEGGGTSGHQHTQECPQGKGQGLIGLQHPGPRRLSTYCGFRGRMAQWRDVRVSTTDYDLRPNDQRECDGSARSHAEHGASPGPCHPVHRGEEPATEPRPVSELLDSQAESHTAMHADRRTINSLIIQMTQELEAQYQQHRPLGKRWDVGEIFCSAQSPIIQQVHNLKAKGFRFGYAEGDLATVEGRRKLFSWIIMYRPRSLWYSPVCGPWSSWSNLNAALSLRHWKDHQTLRHDMLYQLALGIVLYRHQISNGDHMHWEQPGRSLMFKQPGMDELQGHMKTCEFDMCRAGELRDPVNKKFMKKAMQIMTTSKTLYHSLHGIKCNHQHDHQTIEGTTYDAQGPILRTKYSEIYPRKFARTIAKTLTQLRDEKPFQWNPRIHLQSKLAQPTNTCAAVADSRSARDRFPRSDFISPLPETDPQVKRRRVNGKQSPQITKEMCERFMQTIQRELPRVGKREIISSDAWNQIKEIFHDKEIIRMIACRGTDRTLGPPTDLHPDEAPFRRTIMEIRNTQEIKYEANWERWNQLSQRQLVGPAHPCKINVTIFGRDRTPDNAVPTSPPNAELPNLLEARTLGEPCVQLQAEMPVEPPVPSCSHSWDRAHDNWHHHASSTIWGA